MYNGRNMMDILKNIKLLKHRRVHIDNAVLRLHYSITVVILVVFFVVITSRQYVGDPIVCLHVGKDHIPDSMLNLYCWIHSTFTAVSNNRSRKVVEVAYPGVFGTNDDRHSHVKYHKYYQWICFILLFESFCFHAPRWFWKTWEGGKVDSLVSGLFIVDMDAKRKSSVVEYFMRTRGTHDFYAIKFFFCELLFVFNLFAQFYLLNWLFDGEFTKYGIRVLIYYNSEETTTDDPISKLFPKMTKCSFQKYGPSGSLEAFDVLCLLPLNVINEKIFLFLWFWFLLLAIVTIISAAFHLMMFTCAPLRYYLIAVTVPGVPLFYLRKLNANMTFGDWFLLHLFKQNVDLTIYHSVIADLIKNKIKSGSIRRKNSKNA